MPSSSPRVEILLATRNGAEFIAEQLQSYADQTYSTWSLLVSDDGSSDRTLQIIDEFAKRVPQPVKVRQGPKLGFWQNFAALVRAADDTADYFAFSDQDDVWYADKLARAVAWLQSCDAATPALYFTRTELTDRSGRSTGLSPLFVRQPDFRNAMIQNIGGGNTMVFNRAALATMRATPDDVAIVSHDWWAYQVVTGVGGTVTYDPHPSLKYRQHGQNVVGANVGFRSRLARLSQFAGGRLKGWNEINTRMLASLRPQLRPENAECLNYFMAARHAKLPQRLYYLWKSGVHRQTAVENIGLFVGCLFGRI
ncbi:glycosyltransferase family 2 protein [Rhodopseudomonas sp. B29]|uniref:glycosyltransferase family 2 protein n=1 Tax=Rhodopseudomonas sp. B29 TaxID=95607 RepID=UPI000344C334|nr:glycosyltransferase family 2 protein [Rhodopseudomonas sp. B29]